MPYHIRELTAADSVAIFRALGSSTRAQILTLLTDRDMNINELGQALGISQPSVTKHVQILEESGLITSDYTAGNQGMQKRCKRTWDRIIVSLGAETPPEEAIAEIEMPVGMFSKATPQPTCGLASRTGFIGHLDDPLAFHFPERSEAQILWMADGYVEYVFPNTLSATIEITGLELAMEICSETPGYDNSFKSDITIWINDVEIGTWQSPGDMGGRRGRLNPTWWHEYMNQYGFLKVFSVDHEGCYVDGVKISNTKLSDLNVKPRQGTVVRIGIKPDAEFPGGFTLHGRGFGNYEQDLILRLHYPAKGNALTNNGMRSK